MLQKLFTTDNSWIGLICRLTIGIMILPHGAQKLLGWFGGYGFDGTMNFFTDSMKLPYIIALLIILGEFFGGVALILGVGTRFFAAWVGIILLSAMFIVHLENGFFMNWFGNQKGEGIEFFILVLGLTISLLIEGGGKYSVDSILFK
ncbi:MAG TPA: DoxX family protein [Leptospiraceae bacterium]|nr:DoxX family protein [Leptospiraceae bacterium]HMW04901.1 DoxX family protein [Leptospiraceae bacterium]HMX34423.1 DoxX family protein [Leptospiraceae bacterium]HMY30878.1 DoxX family protein [Leptospiraceae bacterium]HMZ62682.1 DoxX family protein [Leptospiraceae bacterium]